MLFLNGEKGRISFVVELNKVVCFKDSLLSCSSWDPVLFFMQSPILPSLKSLNLIFLLIRPIILVVKSVGLVFCFFELFGSFIKSD